MRPAATPASWLPPNLHHVVRAASAALLVTALGSGCTPPAPLPSSHDHHAAGAAGQDAPTGVPAARELDSTCTVQPSTSGAGQLSSVELVVAGDQLVLAFTLAEPVADTLTVKVVAASDAEGAGASTGAGFSITAAVRGTQPVAVALQTPTSSTSAARPGDFVHVEGNQLHIGVPSSLVVQLGRRWHWSASTASAAAHASCPVASGSNVPVTVAVRG